MIGLFSASIATVLGAQSTTVEVAAPDAEPTTVTCRIAELQRLEVERADAITVLQVAFNKDDDRAKEEAADQRDCSPGLAVKMEGNEAVQAGLVSVALQGEQAVAETSAALTGAAEISQAWQADAATLTAAQAGDALIKQITFDTREDAAKNGTPTNSEQPLSEQTLAQRVLDALRRHAAQSMGRELASAAPTRGPKERLELEGELVRASEAGVGSAVGVTISDDLDTLRAQGVEIRVVPPAGQ